MEGLPFDERLVEIIDDDDLALFSFTGLKPTIYVSTGLITTFSIEHLQVAFAHEVAHIHRSIGSALIFDVLLRSGASRIGHLTQDTTILESAH